MRIIRLEKYLKRASKKYERIKEVLGEQEMKAYRIDYDFILFTLLKKELPFKLLYKKKEFEIYTADDLERILLTISY